MTNDRIPSGVILKSNHTLQLNSIPAHATFKVVQTPISGRKTARVHQQTHVSTDSLRLNGLLLALCVVTVLFALAFNLRKQLKSEDGTTFKAAENISLAVIGNHLKKQVGNLYQVDASFLENSEFFFTGFAGTNSRKHSEKPEFVKKQINTPKVLTVSSMGASKHTLPSLSAGNYSSSSLVTRKLVQIIKKKGKSGIDPVGLANKIIAESKKADFDPLFAAAVIKSESAFDRMAVSSAGARGLMQLLPSTGAYIAGLHGFESVMHSRLTDPNYNVRLGIAYLKYLEQMYKGNRVLVLTAYNWGPGRVADAIDGRRKIPADVMTYALKILRDHQEWVNELLYVA